MFISHVERDRAEDVRGEPLLSVLLLGGLVPVGGGEIEDVRRLAVASTEDRVHDRLRLGSSGLELCFGRSLGDLALDAKQLSDQGQGVTGTFPVRLERLPEVASGVSPTGNLDDVALAV